MSFFCGLELFIKICKFLIFDEIFIIGTCNKKLLKMIRDSRVWNVLWVCSYNEKGIFKTVPINIFKYIQTIHIDNATIPLEIHNFKYIKKICYYISDCIVSDSKVLHAFRLIDAHKIGLKQLDISGCVFFHVIHQYAHKLINMDINSLTIIGFEPIEKRTYYDDNSVLPQMTFKNLVKLRINLQYYPVFESLILFGKKIMLCLEVWELEEIMYSTKWNYSKFKHVSIVLWCQKKDAYSNDFETDLFDVKSTVVDFNYLVLFSIDWLKFIKDEYGNVWEYGEDKFGVKKL